MSPYASNTKIAIFLIHRKVDIAFSIFFHVLVFCRELLKDVIPLLQNSGNPQVEYIIQVLRKWAKDNRVLLS